MPPGKGDGRMQYKILEMLKKSAHAYVSGGDIARNLSVSRTAVWKHIHALEDLGYKIRSIPGKGYRLMTVPDLLTPAEIQAGLTTKSFGRDYYYFQELASTNEKLKELARDRAVEGTVVLAEKQSAGRGRLGRSWHSPLGGLWFSLLLRPAILPLRAPELTFVAAVALAETIRTFLNVDSIGIKWPNDLVWQDKKVGGILTELNAEMDRVNYLVIGMGLNVNVLPEDFPEELSHKAASLAEMSAASLSRLGLFLELLQVLEKRYYQWLKEGFGPILMDWKRYDAYRNKQLMVSTPTGKLWGRIVDVDEQGSLLLDVGGQIQKIMSGEIMVEEKMEERGR